jgi:hypothetical protein
VIERACIEDVAPDQVLRFLDDVAPLVDATNAT